jgi:hypothetical protein
LFRDAVGRGGRRDAPISPHLMRGESLAHGAARQVHIRLTRKLAEALNGLDLRPYKVGDVIDLPERLGRMLVFEAWGEEAVAIGGAAVANERAPRRRRPSRARHPRKSSDT